MPCSGDLVCIVTECAIFIRLLASKCQDQHASSAEKTSFHGAQKDVELSLLYKINVLVGKVQQRLHFG